MTAPKRDVQRRSPFGRIDGFAPEQGLGLSMDL